MLPDIHDLRPVVSPERPREIIGVDNDVLDLKAWLAKLVAFWRHADDDQLGKQGVQLAQDILCGSVEVRPALRSLLVEAEEIRIRLTNNQTKILRIIGGRKRAVISGGAGTGKTLIAVEKSRILAASSNSVLLLTYNRPLADALALGLKGEPGITVLGFHQLCERRIAAARQQVGRDLLGEAKEAYPGSGEKHLFEVQIPYALALSNEILAEKFDAVVVDEAQDFSEDYWFSLEELLRDSVEGFLYIFIDENQSLYRKHKNLPVADEPFHLTANCRNTLPIHRAGYVHYSGEAVDEPNLPGQDVHRIAVDGDSKQADAVASTVRSIIESGVRPEEIVVLLAKRPKAQLFAQLSSRRLPAGASWAFESPGQRNAVLVDTVARFKGLESTIAVLWVGDEIVDESLWETLYVGITRAKSLLYVVGSPRALQVLGPAFNDTTST
jgi:superfamily I DNA and RNA helicase